MNALPGPESKDVTLGKKEGGQKSAEPPKQLDANEEVLRPMRTL